MKLPGLDLGGLNIADTVSDFLRVLRSIESKLDTLIELQRASVSLPAVGDAAGTGPEEVSADAGPPAASAPSSGRPSDEMAAAHERIARCLADPNSAERRLKSAVADVKNTRTK